MAKNLFNFYLDDDVKYAAMDKLTRVCGEYSKGQLASLIRVMLTDFTLTPDEQVSNELVEKIKQEYVYNTSKNKRTRSNL